MITLPQPPFAIETSDRSETTPRARVIRRNREGRSAMSKLISFGVTNPATAHAVKKLLMPGQRGTMAGINAGNRPRSAAEAKLQANTDPQWEVPVALLPSERGSTL